MLPHDPLAQDLGAILRPPSATHPLGTDDLGRDVLVRLVDGARASLAASLMAVTISAALGPSLFHDMVAAGVVFAPRFGRLVRGQVLAVREELFVEGAPPAPRTRGWSGATSCPTC